MHCGRRGLCTRPEGKRTPGSLCPQGVGPRAAGPRTKNRLTRAMTSRVQDLTTRGLISPPRYVASAMQLEVQMDSVAYGCSSGDSDRDIYGFCIPPKEVVFPHLAGEIQGFGKQKQRFDQFQQHHVEDPATSCTALGGSGVEYDFAIYNIVKYFQLVMENNPNMIDSLFVPDRCVLFCTDIGQMVLDDRKAFLHKGAWHKFKGYSYSQLSKMKGKNPQPGSKRYKSIQKYGYDVKFAYHIVRLLDEGEQILTEHDLHLDRNSAQLKDIRAGNWTVERIEQYFIDKEKALENLYASSKLRHAPDEKRIKQLLLNCLEQHYGSLAAVQGSCVEQPTLELGILREIDSSLDRIRSKLNG